MLFRSRDSKNGLSIFTELLQSDSGSIGTFGLGRVFARNVDIFDRGGVTEINAAELATESFKTEGLDFGNVSAMGLKIIDTPSQLFATPSKLTLGRFDTDVIVLGEMNLNGVRFAITQKKIEMSADDVEAGPGYIPANSIFARGGDVSGVRFTKPKLVVMPAGTYRVTADIGLGGGVVGNMNLGSARGSIEVTKDFTTISDIEAEVMNGRASGKLTVASGAGESQLKMNFEGVDAARLLTLQGGKVMPFSGIAKGSVDLRFPGDDPRNISGDIVADILPGNVDKNDSIKGKIVVKATSGLFEVSSTSLETAKTSLSASGRFDLKNDRSNLAVKLSSTDADEVSVILRSFDLAKDIQTRLDGFGLSFNGRMKFTGGLRGNIFDPMVSADFELGNLGVKGQALGGLSAKIERDENGFRILDGLLSEADGGRFSFGMVVPSRGDNNISIAGKLVRINTRSLFAVAPVDLPRGIRSLSGDTSGEINLSGLPSQMSGYVSLNGEKVSLSDEIIEFFSLQSRFVGSKVLIDNLTLRFDGGFANITGDIDTVSKNIGFKFVGNGVPLSQLSGLAENPTNFPKLSGVGEMSGEVSGVTDDLKSLIISFTGNGRGVGINGESFGDLAVSGATRGGLLSIKVDNLRQEKGQLIDATVDLGRDGLPFTADVLLKDASLNPYISLFKPNTSASISGRATGRISAAGMLTGNEGVAFSPSISSGNAAFTIFEIQIDETPLVATEPIAIKLTPDAVTFERANFAGGGSNVRISGTKAFSGDADNDFSVVGKVNLSLFNAFVKDTFFSGIADLNVRINGPNDTAKLNGKVEMLSSTLSTFVSGQRVSLERVKGTVIFTSSQAQIQNATGVIGGGKVNISGGARLNQNLELDALKLDLRGENVSVPLPKNFLTTGDVNLSISSRRSAGKLSSFVSGRIGARRSIYATKIDLADVIGKRRDSALASSSATTTSGFGDVTFDVLIEGRDALIVRNNLADLTASLSLRVTGDLNKPVIAGRIVASSGTLFFRSERYEIQRAELIFPPNTSLEPIVNLQAEADIKGYQILVNLNGGLSDIDALNATVRSNPTLPQADVISLITTGNLANAESGIPSSTQTGLSAAADILTDEIISKPISKATDRLFGLNRFEVDPILSGQRLNPTARLTVGRQINRNLLVSYSTNLAQDQNQIVALEYRLSNRLSFVAQYEQRSLSNVTQKANSLDRKSTRLNSSHEWISRMPSCA